MSILWEMIISYLVINLIGSIYESIRNRKHYWSIAEEVSEEKVAETGIELFGNKKLLKTVYWMVMIYFICKETFNWAPLRIFNR